jgi:predicted nuclease with TOPRIM domain
MKNADYDNVKRALDEQQYENENLRRMLHSRQEEIASLHQTIEQQNGSSD